MKTRDAMNHGSIAREDPPARQLASRSLRRCEQGRLIAALLAACWVAASACGQEAQVDKLPRAHDEKFRPPIVTQLVFSPNSGRLVAAYYRLAMNRPGTDWLSWTAQWELKTGRRTILMNSTGPVAFSPDGETLAMGYYERDPDRRHPMRPQVQLGLWKPGEGKPRRILEREKNTSVVAVAMHPGGKYLATATEDGQVLLWPVEADSKPRVIEALKLPLNTDYWGGMPIMPNLKFKDEGGKLTLIVTDSSRVPAKAKKIAWSVDLEKNAFERGETEIIKVETLPTSRGSIDPQRAKLEWISPEGKLKWLSPDGKLKAHADDRGVIVLEDASSGEKIRELRLDDEVGKETK